jgi:asparagine synthase (glutamine-hydrolysing)
MCGICGFVGAGDIADLNAMNATMVSRGPDAEGCFTDENARVYLAHRRLSIIDLSGGAQPMSSGRGNLCITFNGEIYNHKELRAELEKAGHRFRSSHSDTEVLLHGYQQWKEKLPERLNGMWAFAIYDKPAKRIFISRDRFGKKPLFYTCRNGTFAFASELSALCKHRRVESRVSVTSLKKYFAYGYIPAPNSLYEGIHKLPGGCNLEVSCSDLSLKVTRYWDFELEPMESIPANPEAQWGEQIRDLLDRAVSRRLMSDVPLGIFLSGGIDSTSVSYYASRHITPGQLKTFSIGFDEPSFDESGYSNRAALLLGTDHHHETMSLGKALSLLPDIGRRLDEPMGDSSLLPTYLLCQETRRFVTVALGGDGADELFGGYDPFVALRYADLYSRLVPRPVHQAIRLIAARLPVSFSNMSADFRIKRTLRGLSYNRKLWNSVWLGTLEPRELDDLFGAPTSIDEVYSEAIQAWDSCNQTSLVDKTLQFYTKLYLQDDILVKVDRASMMNSLEVRAPFLDIELVDFVRRIPHQYKVHNGVTKYILKKALEPVLPGDILYRKKKGFGVPVGSWLRNGSLSIDAQAHYPSLNGEYARRFMDAHRTGAADHRAFLWNWWVLEHHQDR